MRCTPSPVRDGRRDFGAESIGNTCGKLIASVQFARVSEILIRGETNQINMYCEICPKPGRSK